jgi:hypothetical protein
MLFGVFIGMKLFNTNKELYSSLLGVGLVSIYALAIVLFSRKEKISSYPEIVFVSTTR